MNCTCAVGIIENESERVNRTYDIFNENSRINHSKAVRVEFLTTVCYIEKYLKESDRILDVGAGAGEYSLYFARKGHEVSALEFADANIAVFKVIEENARLIGECNYRNAADGVAEIGIKICEADCQNCGVGRKVLRMLID